MLKNIMRAELHIPCTAMLKVLVDTVGLSTLIMQEESRTRSSCACAHIGWSRGAECTSGVALQVARRAGDVPDEPRAAQGTEIPEVAHAEHSGFALKWDERRSRSSSC